MRIVQIDWVSHGGHEWYFGGWDQYWHWPDEDWQRTVGDEDHRHVVVKWEFRWVFVGGAAHLGKYCALRD